MTPTPDAPSTPPWLLATPPDEAPSWHRWRSERGSDLIVALGLVSAIVMTNLFVDVMVVNVQRGQQLRAEQVAAARAPTSPATAPGQSEDRVLAAVGGGALSR